MTDTVTRLMGMIERYADVRTNTNDWADAFIAKAKIQKELVRLFTPLSDEQIESVNNIWIKQRDFGDFDIYQPSVYEFARAIEIMHGIGGES